MDSSSIIKLVVSILACFAAAVIGSLFAFKAISTWYAGLTKPPYTPPNWAFGPIWTALYLMMAISVFIVWQNGLSFSGGVAFAFFWLQLVVNVLWSVIFFGKKSKGGGVITIIILWMLIWTTIVNSFLVSGWAGALLIPYLVWVSVAAYLNIGIWQLNKPAAQE